MFRFLVIVALFGLSLAQFPVFDEEKFDRDDENVDLQQLVKNPEFVAFFREFQQQKGQKVQQPSTTLAPPQTTPIFDYFPSTQKPRARPVTPKKPKRVHNPKRRPQTTTLPPQHFVQSTLPTFPQFKAISPKEVPQFIPRSNFPTEAPKHNLKNPDLSKFDEEVFRKQAESAKYEFASDTADTINENFHQRQEVRDGLAVRGQYSYSDGYYKRTVHYEADDKGFRVVNEDVEPIGNGPRFNPDGSAKVSQYVAGNVNDYQITKADVQDNPLVLEEEEFEQ